MKTRAEKARLEAKKLPLVATTALTSSAAEKPRRRFGFLHAALLSTVLLPLSYFPISHIKQQQQERHLLEQADRTAQVELQKFYDEFAPNKYWNNDKPKPSHVALTEENSPQGRQARYTMLLAEKALLEKALLAREAAV